MTTHAIVSILCPKCLTVMVNVGFLPRTMHQLVECGLSSCEDFGKRYTVTMPEVELTAAAPIQSVFERGGVYEAELDLKEDHEINQS